MKKKVLITIGIIVLLLFLGIGFFKKGKNGEIIVQENNLNPITSSNYVVEVKGEVNRPGLYIVNSNARVSDVIDLALGFTESADTSIINLASKISDGMQIIVYSINSSDIVEVKNNNLININTASLDELMQIPKIGEVKALAIINYRETYGWFKTIEEITNVSGISESLFEQIKEYITI